jgi:hypothetical protein
VRRLPGPATLRAAWWAWRALRIARRELAGGEVRHVALPEPPHVGVTAMRGVEAALRREPNTCLERALVRQRWLAAHGHPREIIVGVTAPSAGFRAHAWLDGENDPGAPQFRELTRLAP